MHKMTSAVAAICIAASMSHAASAETFSWTQYGPAGLEARALTDRPSCPPAQIDGIAAAMSVRAAPGDAYPIIVCVLPVPPAAKSLAIAGDAIALPATAPKRIAVIGDTGCRLKGIYIQACNDPAQWPFRQIADAVAAQKPDLIIHVGDYHYRETPCPALAPGCAGSPYGDNWATWRADFFTPAAALLPVAPWVFVRGNHEDCERGGKGWSRALEPMPFDTNAGCNGPSQPYVVQFPEVALAVLDVATAVEEKADARQAETFRAQYRSLDKLAPGPTWILQHRPIWSAGGTVAGLPFGDSKTLAAAAQGVIPAQVERLISGHHHIFQVLTYEPDLPVQITSGHGGDYLNPGHAINPAGMTINGVTVKSGIQFFGSFGFAMLDAHADGWLLTNFDVSGAVKNRCGLKGRQAACLAE